MSRPKLRRKEVEAAPYLAWNAFVDLVIMSDHEELTSVQRVAHLAMWYDSEVQNGGHLQYFENRGTQHFQETLAALTTVGAHCQHGVLEEAGYQRLSRRRTPIHSVTEYVARAHQDEYGSFDHRYHECKPELCPELLEAYLWTNINEFIEWT
jgi:hypothetical protein